MKVRRVVREIESYFSDHDHGDSQGGETGDPTGSFLLLLLARVRLTGGRGDVHLRLSTHNLPLLHNSFSTVRIISSLFNLLLPGLEEDQEAEG